MISKISVKNSLKRVYLKRVYLKRVYNVGQSILS